MYFSEDGFIEYLSSSTSTQHIGDDAASLGELIVSKDMMIEGVHFREEADPYAVGWKLVAVNISDIAAMGAIPEHFLLGVSSVSLPQWWFKGFVSGLRDCLLRYDVKLIGGDTTASLSHKAFSGTILGRSLGRVAKLSSANPGQDIIVSGPTGLSAAGFDSLCMGLGFVNLEKKHLLPTPQIPKSTKIMQGLDYDLCMTDLSDSLSYSASKIAQQSKVSMLLDLECFMVDPDVQQIAQMLDKTENEYMLWGGEDYQLLATAYPGDYDSNDWIRIGRVEACSSTPVQIFQKGNIIDVSQYQSQEYKHFNN